MKHEVPLHVRLALKVILNHIEEPESWANCKTAVSGWLECVYADEEEEKRTKAEDTPA